MGPSGAGPEVPIGSGAGLGSPGGRWRVGESMRRSGTVEESVGVSVIVFGLSANIPACKGRSCARGPAIGGPRGRRARPEKRRGGH
jgi:hypothetical protein